MLIETKLHHPKVTSALISRPRLRRRLDDGLHVKLTLVTAAAGYGKTTLASEWASSLQAPVAWVSLDARDREPNRFWRYTLAALKQAYPNFDEQSVLRFVSAAQTEPNFIAAFINQLQCLTETMVLVWDDFHQAAEPAIVQAIDYLLERLPSHVHLYILSRNIPSLTLAKMRTAHLLNEIKMEELRFSTSETEDFFHQQRIPGLLPEEMDALIKQTEGWAAGLRLAALYLHEEPERTFKNLDKWGEWRNVSDYFLEEVFRHQTPDMQSFLLKTSPLDRMNAELCQIMTGINRSQAYLQQLEQMNCFLVPLDEEREWYRYHQLFQDFLQAKGKQSPLEHGQANYQHAGKWFEGHDYWEEALSLYIAGDHYTQAIKVLTQQIPLLIRTELGTLRYWCAQIPDKLLVEQPTLLMSDIFALFLLGDIETAQQKLREVLHKWNHKQLEPVRGGLMMLQLLGLLFARDFEAAIHYSEKYVRAYPKGDTLASLMGSLGTEGDFNVSDSSLLETVNHIQERERITSRLLDIWSKSNEYYLYTELNLGYGDTLYERNQLDEAILYWNEAKRLGEKNGNVMIATISTLKLVQGYAAQGKKVKAEKTLAELHEQIDFQQYPRLAHFANLYQAYLRLQWGEVEQAGRLFKYDHLQVKDEISSTMLLEYDVFACLLAEHGRNIESLELLRRLTYVAHRSERMSETIRFLTRQSLILYAAGDAVESMELLEEALAMAESNGYLRTVLDGGRPMMILLQKYLEARMKRHRRPKIKVSLHYVKRLLKLHIRSVGESQDLDAVRDHSIHLTEKELVVLQCMAMDLKNKEIAARLGVSLNTVKTHIHHIYGKFYVNNRMAAIERAKTLNFLPPTPPIE